MSAPLTPDQIAAMAPADLLRQRLANYLAAEARILRAQETRIGDGVTIRQHRNAELAEVRAQIEAIQGQIAGLAARSSIYYLR